MFSRIIFDEAHYYKNPSDGFIKSLNNTFTKPGPSGTPWYQDHRPYKWSLSATPIDTSPADFIGSRSILERPSWSEEGSTFYWCRQSIFDRWGKLRDTKKFLSLYWLSLTCSDFTAMFTAPCVTMVVQVGKRESGKPVYCPWHSNSMLATFQMWSRSWTWVCNLEWGLKINYEGVNTLVCAYTIGFTGEIKQQLLHMDSPHNRTLVVDPNLQAKDFEPFDTGTTSITILSIGRRLSRT